MASSFPGYEYDIFISYRQKDNKYDGWITDFVTNLRKELEATSKEDINVFFDTNPQDGLLESYDVDESLKEKLKCLIFIPIISRTYCDPKSFAWEHEFKAFIELASNDVFGLKVRLHGGNVASRILPVRIYDLDPEDINLCETVLGGPLRSIDFIYKSAGVNRPLRANEDHAPENLNKTYYRDQINKLGQSIQEILDGLRINLIPGLSESDKKIEQLKQLQTKTGKKIFNTGYIKNGRKVLSYLGLALILIGSMLAIKHLIYNKNELERSTSEEILNKAISIVDPLNDWSSTYDGKIRVRFISTLIKSEYDVISEIDNETDYWRHYQSSDKKKGWFVKNGEYYSFEVKNNNSEEVLPVKDSVVLARICRIRMDDKCSFGFLMELKSSGLILDRQIIRTKFHGHYCSALTFNSSDSDLPDSYFKGVSCTIYIDRSNYSLIGYTFKDPEKNPYYCILAGTVRVNGQYLPLCKTYFNSSDDSFMGVIIITPDN
jgi:hypothetical protein